MALAGRYFVTPHAVRQFQQRIAPLDYEQALAAIIHGLTQTTATPRSLHSGRGIMLRVRRPFAFRAVIVAGTGERPAVATILKSGKRRRHGNL